MSVSAMSLEQLLAFANAKMRAGLAQEGIAAFERAIALVPMHAPTHLTLGQAYHSCGRLDDAIRSYRRAVELQPDFLHACLNLSVALREQNQFDEAIGILQHALKFAPANHEIWNDLGLLLQTQNRFDEAIAAHRHAIKYQPRWALGWLNLGNALFKVGRLDDAIAALRQTALLDPQFAQGCTSLANMLRAAGKFDEALQACASALKLHPNSSHALNVQGNILLAKGDIAGAIAAFREAIAAEPDNASAHYNLGMTRLLNGQLEEGWRECEWRLRFHRNLVFTAPAWDGHSDLAGKTLLLYREQGIGDAIQFIRYIPKLAALGAKVILQIAPELVELMRRCGIDAIAFGDPLPQYDLHFSLLSLPAAFETTLDTIPPPMSLPADPEKSRRWKERLGNSTLNVGLAWAGSPTHLNDRNRSMPLSTLAPLLEVKNVQFVSLQKDAAGAEPVTMPILDFTSELQNFADTADLIDALDLVISVDTAVAHLAGTMGKPVWLLLPFVPDWRWMLDRDDSLWYPTMKLFRKRKIDDWEITVREVVGALREFQINHA